MQEPQPPTLCNRFQYTVDMPAPCEVPPVTPWK